eukprot:gene30997-38870_t
MQQTSSRALEKAQMLAHINQQLQALDPSQVEDAETAAARPIVSVDSGGVAADGGEASLAEAVVLELAETTANIFSLQDGANERNSTLEQLFQQVCQSHEALLGLKSELEERDEEIKLSQQELQQARTELDGVNGI